MLRLLGLQGRKLSRIAMLPPGLKLGRYEILGAIGAGGMGEVYRAQDTRLHREVAIKVLPPERAIDENARQRFLREARAASALNHPNIITIYETDTHDGVAYIAMEYVRGKSLAALLEQGPLAVEQAVGYARQVAEALAKAHSAGIVHRDLKPGNIMVSSDGLVKVLDFGLAKHEVLAEDQAGKDSPTRSASLSAPGSTLGTLYYMSPEQARGETVDARSDIFSFGVVLFEMLTGELPFTGDNLLAFLHALHFNPPREIRSLRPQLPEDVAAIVDRCLQKLPADRYRNATEICDDLSAFSGEILPRSSTAVRKTIVSPSPTIPRAGLDLRRPGRRRWVEAAIAVLVLAAAIAVATTPSLRQKLGSLTGRPASDGRGGAERIPDNPFALQRQAQTYLERWDVPANLDRSITLLNRAIELDHDYAPAYASLTFAYFEKNRINADPQWAKEATQSAARSLQLNSDLADAHLAGGVSAMLNGHNDEAEREFRKAADLVPKSSKPHRWLGFMFNSSGKSKPAEEELTRALALNQDDWRARMNLGLLYYKTARYPEAATAWEKVSRLAPDNFVVLNNLAAVYHMMDRYEDSAAALQRSLEIKPIATTYNNLGTLRFFQGRYDDAVPAFEKAVQMHASNYYYWGNLGDAYRWAPGQAGKAKPAYENAIRLAREGLAAHPQDLDLRANLALYLAKNGDPKTALAQIGEIDRAPKKEAGDFFRSAVVHELCGERDQAMASLSAALKAGYALREIKNDPELVALRTDTRYQFLLAGRPAK